MTPVPPAMPPACCPIGAGQLEILAAAAVDDDRLENDVREIHAALSGWINHQIDDHRITGVPVEGCLDCLELSTAALGDPLDVSKPLDFAAAHHYVEHQVKDPMRAAHKALRVATLGNHGDASQP